jgi:hypothetical protein
MYPVSQGSLTTRRRSFFVMAGLVRLPPRSLDGSESRPEARRRGAARHEPTRQPFDYVSRHCNPVLLQRILGRKSNCSVLLVLGIHHHVPCQPQAAPVRLVAAVRQPVQGKSMLFGSIQIPFGCVQRFTASGTLAVGPESGRCMERQKIMPQSTGWRIPSIVVCQ